MEKKITISLKDNNNDLNLRLKSSLNYLLTVHYYFQECVNEKTRFFFIEGHLLFRNFLFQ